MLTVSWLVVIGKVDVDGKTDPTATLVTLSKRTGGSALNVMLQSGTSELLKVNTFTLTGDVSGSVDVDATTTCVTDDKSIFGTANVCNVGTAFGQI